MLDTILAHFRDFPSLEVDITIPTNDEIEDSFLPYAFRPSAQKYFGFYNFVESRNWLNIEFHFIFNSTRVGIAVLTINFDLGTISSGGEPILLPAFAPTLPVDIKQKIALDFMSAICTYALKNAFSPPIFQEYGVSIPIGVYETLIPAYKQIETRVAFYKDCSGSRSDLWLGIRKSYKSYINKGLRELDAFVITGEKSMSIFDQFRDLHKKISGRITRVDETWEIQKESVIKGNAFLSSVMVEKRLIGGSLIMLGNNSALYAVGVYDHNFSHLHLGHVSQWMAIRNLNSLGIDEYRLGHLNTTAGAVATQKELGIAHFKRGFSSRTIEERTFYS